MEIQQKARWSYYIQGMSQLSEGRRILRGNTGKIFQPLLDTFNTPGKEKSSPGMSQLS